MFIDAVKEKDESYVNLSTRLSLNLGYYLDSHKVTTFKELVDLLIIHKLKSCRLTHTRKKLRECEMSGESISLQDSATMADLYETDRPTFEQNSFAKRSFEPRPFVNNGTNNLKPCFKCKSDSHKSVD